jgi:hypothetical protein
MGPDRSERGSKYGVRGQPAPGVLARRALRLRRRRRPLRPPGRRARLSLPRHGLAGGPGQAAAAGSALQGFLVGNSARYGGGDVADQIKRMESAAEATGPASSSIRRAGGLPSPDRPGDPRALGRGQLRRARVHLRPGRRAGLPGGAGRARRPGLQGRRPGRRRRPRRLRLQGRWARCSRGWATPPAIAPRPANGSTRSQGLARDATSLYGTVSQLGGADFGRYFNGRNAGFLAGLTSPTPAPLGRRPDRAGAANASPGRPAAAGRRGDRRDRRPRRRPRRRTSPRRCRPHVAALQASAADPADGLRILTASPRSRPSGAAAATLAGLATPTCSSARRPRHGPGLARLRAVLGRRRARRARPCWRPLDAAIAAPGNTAPTRSSGPSGLRKAVVDDLGERGGGAGAAGRRSTLPAKPLPAVVIAQRQLRRRQRAPPSWSPRPTRSTRWFMPTALQGAGELIGSLAGAPRASGSAEGVTPSAPSMTDGDLVLTRSTASSFPAGPRSR